MTEVLEWINRQGNIVIFRENVTIVKLINTIYPPCYEDPMVGSMYECEGVVAKVVPITNVDTGEPEGDGWSIDVMWKNGKYSNYHPNDLVIIGYSEQSKKNNPNLAFKSKKRYDKYCMEPLSVKSSFFAGWPGQITASHYTMTIGASEIPESFSTLVNIEEGLVSNNNEPSILAPELPIPDDEYIDEYEDDGIPYIDPDESGPMNDENHQ